MKHTRGAERQDPDATASTSEEEAVDDKNRERGAQDEVNGKGIEKPRVQESTQLRALIEETVEQPTDQRERGRVQGRREGSRAPTKPQGTEKTTIYNLAEGRGESQEEQPMPRTIQKNGLEGCQAKAEELDPTRKVGKSDWKITVEKRRDTNRYATRRWRGTIQATKVAKTDTGANQESPRGERLEQEGPRERERSGTRIMKRRTENLEPQTKTSRKGTIHQAETTNSPQGTRATGTRALRPLTET